MKRELIDYIEPSTVLLKSEATWPGFYGSIRNGERLMLIRNWPIYTHDEGIKDLYQWQRNDLTFIAIGKESTIQKIFKCSIQQIYKFDSLTELASWMES